MSEAGERMGDDVVVMRMTVGSPWVCLGGIFAERVIRLNFGFETLINQLDVRINSTYSQALQGIQPAFNAV